MSKVCNRGEAIKANCGMDGEHTRRSESSSGGFECFGAVVKTSANGWLDYLLLPKILI